MGIFDKMFDITIGAIKRVIDKDITKRALGRRFSAAYDNCENQKMEALRDISDQEANVETFDVNAFLKAKNTVFQFERQQEWIKEEYKIFFDKEMKTSDLD